MKQTESVGTFYVVFFLYDWLPGRHKEKISGLRKLVWGLEVKTVNHPFRSTRHPFLSVFSLHPFLLLPVTQSKLPSADGGKRNVGNVRNIVMNMRF